MNIISFGLGRSSFRSPLHPRVLALLLFSLSLSPGTFSPTLGLEARATQVTARQASRGDQQSGSVASRSTLEPRIRPSLSAFSSSRSYHGSSSSLHGPPRLHVLAESLVNAPDSEVLRLKEKQQLRREALREWALRHDLDPKDFDLTKKTPEEAIADSVEHDGKVAVRELGIRKGFGIRNWLLLQLGMLAIFLLLLYLVHRGADTHDARQSFNAIASADSEEAGQAGRRGHGASGHARMLDYLSIDTDGGLDRIHTEFFHKSHWGRFIRVCVVVGGGLMNVIVLSLVSIFMMDAFCRYLGGIPIMELDELSRWSSMDLQMRRQFLPFAALIAFIELVVITYLFAACLERMLVFCLSKKQFDRYDSLRELIWILMPLAATFSALKALRFVHPSLVAENFQDSMRSPVFGDKWWSKALQFMSFAFVRMAAFFLGLCAFGVKIVESGAYFQDDQESFFLRWGYIASFLYQALMIVLLDVQYNRRILRMFFAGADSSLDSWEQDMMRVYQIRVVQAIWRSYTGLQRIALLATFDHYDFQRLLLKEDEERKQYWVKRTHEIRQGNLASSGRF